MFQKAGIALKCKIFSPNGPEFELLGGVGKLGKSLANALKTKHNI